MTILNYQSPFTGQEIDVYLAKAATALQADTGVLLSSVDDVPVDGATMAPISSNWAYDHAAGLGGHVFTQAGTGAVARTLEAKLKDTVCVKDFGAVGNGVADDTNAIHAALAAAKQVLFPSGTYLVMGITIPSSSKSLVGETGSRPTLLLKSGANAHVIYGDAVDDVELHNLIIDGNKTNQTVGTNNNWRGIYFYGACHRLRFDNVVVQNVVDHGIFLSDAGDLANETGKHSLLTNCMIIGCGSSAHSSAGGAGGSGFVGGTSSAVLVGCVSTGNHLTGFKSGAQFISCEAIDNNGSGWETGFSTPEYTSAKYVGCRSISNGGDGWRNQGQGDRLTWVGCEIANNGASGLFFLNGARDMIITGCTIVNNGQAIGQVARSDTIGFDGISFCGTSTTPANISIANCFFLDDQQTPTQDCHIYFREKIDNVTISEDCYFGAVRTAKVYFEIDATETTVNLGRSFGLGTTVRDYETQTLTGTTNETELQALTIPARAFAPSVPLKVVAGGNVTGTNGTKLVRFKIASTAITVANEAAGDQQPWLLEAWIRRNGSSLFVSYVTHEAGGTTNIGVEAVSHSFTNALTLQVTGQLGNAGDTITQTIWQVMPE